VEEKKKHTSTESNRNRREHKGYGETGGTSTQEEDGLQPKFDTGKPGGGKNIASPLVLPMRGQTLWHR